jgi:uncharacterized protein YkwD
MPAFIPNYNDTNRAREEILQQVKKKTNSHPCLQFTLLFWDNPWKYLNAQNDDTKYEQTTPETIVHTDINAVCPDCPKPELIKNDCKGCPLVPTASISKTERKTERETTITTDNKYGYRFVVPREVYSNPTYREYLDDAESISSVKVIVDEYYRKYYGKTKPPNQTETNRKRPIKAIITLFAIAILSVVLIMAMPSILSDTFTQPNNPLVSSTHGLSTTPTSTLPITPPVLTPIPTATSIPDTEKQSELVNYALSLINADRQKNGLQNVTLSSINSGQVHADEMLANDYFSHWDTNGYKPYMRYTLAGGEGAVAENCAWQGLTGNIFGIDVKSALSDLEYSMIYEDAASNWGHRDNILDPLHNKVSIGIAYDNHNIYLVQDFEDDYVSWSSLSASNNQVTMRGTITQKTFSFSQIGIYYDKTASLTSQQLSNAPYQGGYDSGTYVGMVVSPPPEGSYYDSPTRGILIEASTWSQSGQSFSISFDLSSAKAKCGSGVYTLYLWTDSDCYLTTYSIWIS